METLLNPTDPPPRPSLGPLRLSSLLELSQEVPAGDLGGVGNRAATVASGVLASHWGLGHRRTGKREDGTCHVKSEQHFCTHVRFLGDSKGEIL